MLFVTVVRMIVDFLKYRHRGFAIVIRQTCHSIMADKYYYSREKYLATISVALTAVISTAIFTSVSPQVLSEGTIDHNSVHHTTVVGDIDMPILAAKTDGGHKLTHQLYRLTSQLLLEHWQR